jgi:hypothetical protein
MFDVGWPLFEGALKRKLVVSLICFLLFVAAVDSIPDPFAINPPAGHSSGISALHVRGSVTLLEKEWFVAFHLTRQLQANWFSLRLAFDIKPLCISSLPLIHQAADPSPPCIS